VLRVGEGCSIQPVKHEKGLNTMSDQMNALTSFAAANEKKYGNYLLGANVFNVWMRAGTNAKQKTD
jgi:hypothetical protein